MLEENNMRVLVSYRSVIKQIDDQSKGREVPEQVIVEGIEAPPVKDELRDQFPDIYRQLTYTQYQLFRLLYSGLGRTFSRAVLEGCLPVPTGDKGWSNRVDVHIKLLRYALKKHKFPFHIETIRKMGYIMRKI